MITTEEFKLAYIFLLGREPEQEALTPTSLAYYKNVEHLRGEIVRTPEFRERATLMLNSEREEWIFKNIGNNRYLPLCLSDLGVSLPILWRNSWEPETTTAILNRLHKDSCFVDVGANIGWFSIKAADFFQQSGGTGLVYVFEPQRKICTNLAQAAQLSGLTSYLNINAVAVGNDFAPCQMQSKLALGNLGGSFVTNSPLADIEYVPTVKLDYALAQLQRLDVIKIDIEGSELNALRGGSKILERFLPDIFIELNAEMLQAVGSTSPLEVYQFLREFGYSCFLVEDAETRAQCLSEQDVFEITNRRNYPNFLFTCRY